MVIHDNDQSSTAIEGVAATTIELLDNGVSLGPVTMTGPTTWSKQVSGLVAGSQHSFLAREPGGGPSSNPWNISIRNKLTGSENFEGLPIISLQPGQRYETLNMTIVYLSGDGLVHIENYSHSFPGQVEGRVLSVAATNMSTPLVARLELKGSCSRVSFWHIANFSVTWLVFYNSAGEVLTRRLLKSSDGHTAEEVFENPDIAVVEIEFHRTNLGEDRIRFDWFRFS